MAADLTVPEIKRLLIERCPGLVFELVPGCKKTGRMYSAPNPTRGKDGGGSFKVWPNGKYAEFDEQKETGLGDILGLIAYVNNYAPKSAEGRRFAVKWAKQYLGLDNANPRAIAGAKRRASKEAEDRHLREEQEEQKRRFMAKMHVKEICDGARRFAAGDDNLVTRYLAGRGIDLEAIVGLVPILGFHPKLQHWVARTLYPAMVAPMFNAELARTGVHCTFLDPAGGTERKGKADVSPDKMMRGDMKGSFVPLTLGPGGLTVSEAIAQGKSCPVVLCEGIETGLSLAMAIGAEARVWACLNLGNIGEAPMGLACISSIVVATENDTKPQAIKSRENALDRLATFRKPLTTMRPHFGSDFNDLLTGN